MASYDDALNGVITSRTDPSAKRSDPIATGQPVATEGFEGSLEMRLTRPSQLVVAADPEDRLYAYTQQKVAENLPRTYVTLTFKPLPRGPHLQRGQLGLLQRLLHAPGLPRLHRGAAQAGGRRAALRSPSPSPRRRSGPTLSPPTPRSGASPPYTDALNGVITSKLDPEQQRQNPEATAYPEETAYVMSVSHSQLMVVVVDRTSSMYAYSQQTVDLTGPGVAFEVTFRPWERKYLYVEEGWRVVDDAFRPENPETPAGLRPADKLTAR